LDNRANKKAITNDEDCLDFVIGRRFWENGNLTLSQEIPTAFVERAQIQDGKTIYKTSIVIDYNQIKHFNKQSSSFAM
jgi:hypothetical protein